jgi:hypothetical protein
MDDLVLDLLQWLEETPKPYTDVMDAWRTSCPRLTVWEDAIDAGYLEKRLNGATLMVAITDRGRRHLARNRSAAA